MRYIIDLLAICPRDVLTTPATNEKVNSNILTVNVLNECIAKKLCSS